jgi:hypothetical protein
VPCDGRKFQESIILLMKSVSSNKDSFSILCSNILFTRGRCHSLLSGTSAFGIFSTILALEKSKGLRPEMFSISLRFWKTEDLAPRDTILARCLTSLLALKNKPWKKVVYLDKILFFQTEEIFCQEIFNNISESVRS